MSKEIPPYSTSKDKSIEELRSTNYLVILFGSACVLFHLVLFHLLFTEGLGVVFLIFAYTFPLLALFILVLIKGIRKRKTIPYWYVYSLLILCFIVFLWSPPFIKPTRSALERTYRMNARELVIEDIKSGKLSSENGIIHVPFEKYGRVSFYRNFSNPQIDNAISTSIHYKRGLGVSFTTDARFFAHKDVLTYYEIPVNGKHWIITDGSLFDN
ncbi:MAG: hypothetical protein ACI837_001709 [Crocinitomicaceae bacterium]|jgi:hypothetical protein